MKKARVKVEKNEGKKSYDNHVKWRIFFTIFWVIIIPLFFILLSYIGNSLGSSFLIFGVMFLLLGLIATFFNKRLYEHMVKVNVWGFGKMGAPEFGSAVKSNIYRKFYRIVVSLAGLLLIFLGIFSILLHFGIDLMNIIQG